MFFKKNIKYIILITILLVILVYVTNITSIPNTIILFQNEELNIKTITGLQIEETIPVAVLPSDSSKQINNVYNRKYNLSLLGLNIKTITANIIPHTKVIPLGNIIGIKLNTKGVLVVGMSQIKGEDKKTYKPYEQAGIEQGDSIIKINNKTVNTANELIKSVSKCKGETIKVTYIQNNKQKESTITPVKINDNTYKIGLWVRDTQAGVGTLTFYDTTTNSFAALGHGIQDIDTRRISKYIIWRICNSRYNKYK